MESSLTEPAGPDHGATIYSPSELNAEIRLHLEAGFPRVLVEGEVSNLSRPGSGHLYFSLKDESAQIRCAMFRSAAQRNPLQPRNGMKVLARGRITLYEARGEYQLVVDGLREAGEGLLQQRFEWLKRKLEAEGLFAAERKRPLPRFPLRIGIITSASGAAVRDILHVLERRWPVAAVRVYAASVQGAEAPVQIVAALARANRDSWAQVLILGRGGGSLEDLQAFNEESVARAVAASALPTVSAVGHETDFSITDFVADLRAPTPSAAAEVITPDGEQVRRALERLQRLLTQRIQAGLQQRMQRLDYLAHRLAQRDPRRRLAEQSQQLSFLRAGLGRSVERHLADRRRAVHELSRRLQLQHPRLRLRAWQQGLDLGRAALVRNVRLQIARSAQALSEMARTLHAVSPLATLDRGYAILQDESGAAIVSVRQVHAGDPVKAQLRDGRLGLRVECHFDLAAPKPPADRGGGALS